MDKKQQIVNPWRTCFGHSEAFDYSVETFICPMGMARIIDTKRMIHLWLSKQHESPVSKKDLEQMDNQTLTRQLMGYQGRMAYMSLMLD